jgi:uncharacterized membrane protein
MILGISYYEICWYFLIYSFLGWVVEVVYHVAKHGRIINRGFLNGPVCPVYGFGMIGMLLMLKGLHPTGVTEQTNVAELFVLGMVLCSAIELFAGWLLDVLFHARWWDYSREPYNLHGYICLRFSLVWGLAAVIVLGMIHPIVRTASVGEIPQAYGWWALLWLYLIYFADLLVTVATIVGLNRKLREIELLRRSMRSVSDSLTQKIGTTAVATTVRIDEGKVQATLAKEDLKDKAAAAKQTVAEAADGLISNLGETRAEVRENLSGAIDSRRTRLDSLRASLQADIHSRTSGVRRLLKAFPDLRSSISSETLPELREQLREEEDSRTRHSTQPEEKEKAAH